MTHPNRKRIVAALKSVVGDNVDPGPIDEAIDSGKAPKPILSYSGVKGNDLRDAFHLAFQHAWGGYDEDTVLEDVWEEIVTEWNDSFNGASVQTVPLETAIRKYGFYAHGRTLENQALNNTIIVGKIGGDHTVLDGNHRLVTKHRKDHKEVKVLLLNMPRFFDFLLAMETHDGDHFWETKELI